MAANNEVIVTLAQSETSEAALDQGRAAIVGTLTANYSATGGASQGKLDLDNTGRSSLAAWLAEKDPEHLGQSDAATQHYTQQANAILDYRDSAQRPDRARSTAFREWRPRPSSTS